MFWSELLLLFFDVTVVSCWDFSCTNLRLCFNVVCAEVDFWVVDWIWAACWFVVSVVFLNFAVKFSLTLFCGFIFSLVVVSFFDFIMLALDFSFFASLVVFWCITFSLDCMDLVVASVVISLSCCSLVDESAVFKAFELSTLVSVIVEIFCCSSVVWPWRLFCCLLLLFVSSELSFACLLLWIACISSAYATFGTPNISVTPIKIEAVPTLNFLIECSCCLFSSGLITLTPFFILISP